MVEIAKVLAIEERTSAEPVVLLDEPTSVLDGEEIETLFAQIERLRTQASVIFVSHRLDEVLRISDRVYVLRNGEVAGEVDPRTASAADLHRMMIGRDATGSHYHEDLQGSDAPGSARLRVDALCGPAFADVTFHIGPGEVVSIAGVQGSGRQDLCRALFGGRAVRSGTVELDGVRLDLDSPRSAVRAGIGYVPSERKVEGVVSAMSVAENMTMAHSGAVSTGPFLNRVREATVVDTWIERLSIRTPSRATAIGRLSGGNQQKVVLARWLFSGSLKVLLLDHPTRGLDVGAKSEVYRLIRELAATGVSLLLLADSLEESIAMSDRVLVMREGRIVATVPAPPGAKPDPMQIMKEMA